MQFEIAIEGPLFAISKLAHEIGSFSPSVETLRHRGRNEGGWGKISILEAHENSLDDKLLTLTRIITELERNFSLATEFDITIRNLSYSEPSAEMSQLTKPFQPVSSITIQPWGPSIPKIKDSGTIILDSNHAFGMGRHPTTRLCLIIMDLIAKDRSRNQKLHGREVLDFGCGTGLLAITAVKLGAQKALGVEIDHCSVMTAKRNVELNHLSHKIEIREGSWEVVHKKYDFVFANLVASALLRTGHRIPTHLRDHGTAVVSGFGEKQLEDIRHLFTSMGLFIYKYFALKGWSAFVMGKKG